MRKRILLLVAVLMVVVSCQKESVDSEPLSAARQIYSRYAPIDGLTVALVGNYAMGGDTVNAVMLQAQNIAVWRALLDNFHIKQQNGEGTKVLPPAVMYVQADTVVGEWDGCFDSIQHPMMAEIPRLNNRPAAGSRQHWKKGTKGMESAEEEIEAKCDPNVRRVRIAISGGQMGYTTYAESESMTLWLFFFSDKSQYVSTMEKVGDPKRKQNK